MMELDRRSFLLTCGALQIAAARPENWYQRSFYLLHEDHHTGPEHEVGKDADPEKTARLIGLSKPDVIQIHAKGNPGWTTYPSKIGHNPPKLARDVMQVWSEIARRHGYRFSAYYNLGRDGEIMNRRPEWNRVRASGEPYERALCYHSGVAEGYLWPMIDEIMDRYRPDGFWFDGSCFTVSVCYCPKCRERFRREHSLEAPTAPDVPGWDAYKEMQRQIYREFVRATAARIKKRNPACLVAVNWAYSQIMPEPADEAFDYLTGDRSNEVDMLSRDAHWYDAQARPFDLMTNVRLSTPDQPKPAGQIQQEMAIIIANGGRFFVWDNPTPTSGLVKLRQEFLAREVAPFLRARQNWCLGTQRVPEVSLLYCSADHYAVMRNTPVCFARGAKFGPCADLLTQAHLDYEYIHDGKLEHGEIRSPLLIVNDPAALPDFAAPSIQRYLEGGGAVLLTGNALRMPALGELRGRVFRQEVPLAPGGGNPAILEKALPSALRQVTTDAAPEVEIVHRRGAGYHVVHLVNRARGKREVLSEDPRASRVRITEIPPVPPCRVSVLRPVRPKSVLLQPGSRPVSWTYSKGRVEAQVPQFALYEMVVIS